MFAPSFIEMEETHSTVYISGVQCNDLTYIHHEIFVTIGLLNVIIAHRYNIKETGKKSFFLVMRTLRIYCLTTFIYNIYQC